MLCHHCQKLEATRANDTFCESCGDQDGWDPTDRELLARLGRKELLAWRRAANEARDYETVDMLDASGLTGLSRWVDLATYSTERGIHIETVRRAIQRGMPHRRVGARYEVISADDMPPTQRTGPRHSYEVRAPGATAWWKGHRIADARRELKRAHAAGMSAARIICDGEWLRSESESE